MPVTFGGIRPVLLPQFSEKPAARPNVAAPAARPKTPFRQLGAAHFAGVISGITFGNKQQFEASIPVVDLSRFVSATTEAEKQAFARDFGQKWQKYGFIAIKNHGIDKALFDRHFQTLAQALGREQSELSRYQIDEVGKRVGYYPPGELKPGKDGKYTAPDPKHMWHTGAKNNVYPLETPEFARVNYQLFSEMKQVGDVVVDVLERFLGDERGLLRQFVYTGEKPEQGSMMRAIHYPKLNPAERESVRTVEQDGVMKWVRTGEHRDIGLFTLLPEATDSGLQLLPNTPENDTADISGVQKDSNQWLDVYAQDGYLILNAGDALMHMTDGLSDKQGNSLKIPSTWHRVVGDAKTVDRDRFSVPFFFDGNWLNTMPHFATGQPVRRQEAPYNGMAFDPALRMLWARYGRSGGISIPFEQYRENYRNMGETVRRVLDERQLAAAYHAGL